MKKYKPYLGRVDLVKNQVEREKLAEQEATSKKKRSIQQQNKQRWLKYQEQLRSELAARYFHSVQSTGGESFSNKYSLALDGNNDYVDCGDADNLSFGNGTTDSPFSISTWVNMTDATKFRIVTKAVAGVSNSNEYALFLSGTDQLFFQLYDLTVNDKRNRYYTTPLTSYEGQWIHIVATYSGVGGNNAQNGIKLYLNGNRIDNASGAGGNYTAMHNTNAIFEIGKLSTSYSNGLIDELAIFNTVLSASDVTTIYNDGVPNDISNLSPLSWWRMGDGDTFPTLTDNGSGGNNGTMTNMDSADIVEDVPGS